ncbi:hypothetical protein Syun_016081 [Stephania yunnanensis]|uniref:Uncharacterized protein n=1 Tax=Stephania yunnanensis TaxID=152371 RepID=A0AAP0P248_9MAGN
MAHAPSSNNIIVLMDVLWFQQIILISSSQSINKVISTSTNNNPLLNLKASSSQTPSISSPSHSSHLDDDDDDDDDIEDEALDVSSSSDSSPLLPREIEEELLDDEEATMKYKRKRPTRLSLVIASKTRSHSSSPSIHKLPKHMREQVQDYINMTDNSSNRLRRTKSLKSLEELEFEEVKGFMDLGFTFEGGQLNPRMMSVIPGLQRLVGSSSTTSIDDDQLIMDDQDDQKSIMSGTNKARPYLSEAWLIKRPDSPLLNLRIPRIKGTSSDVKKQIISWARNVASAIQLEH